VRTSTPIKALRARERTGVDGHERRAEEPRTRAAALERTYGHVDQAADEQPV
jgi:hypothetical protein